MSDIKESTTENKKINAIDDLFKAIRADKRARDIAESDGVQLTSGHTSLKNWMKAHPIYVIFGFLLIFALFEAIEPFGGSKKKHHGISRFTGRRY